jgi:hypothetical protein
MKKSYIIATAIQIFFGLVFLASKHPEVHWCCIAPLVSCGFFIYLSAENEE